MKTSRRQWLAGTGAMLLSSVMPGVMPLARAQQEATLRFSWWGGNERHQRTLAAIEAFQAKNPDIRIKAEYSGYQGYVERLTTQIAGNTEPDLMQSDWAWLPMFSRNGEGFLDLGKYRGTLALDQFGDDTLRWGTIKGRLNALPVSFTGRVFVWNKTAFDRAGLPLPKTWDDLLALGPQVQKKLGSKGYVLDGDSLDMLLLAHTYAWQKYGQPYVSPSEPKVAMPMDALREWVQAYKRLTSNHVGVPQPYRASLGGADTPTEQQPDWVNGNWLGYCAWDSATRLRVAALAAPQTAVVGDFLTLPGAKASGMLGRPSMMLAVSKNTKSPQAAVRFVNFMLTDPEAARILGTTRGIPLAQSQIKALQQDGKIDAVPMQAFQQIAAMRNSGKLTPPSPLFENPRMARLVRDIFDQVAYDKISAEDAAKRLQDEGNAMLQRLRY